jgi:hypothetical protein
MRPLLERGTKPRGLLKRESERRQPGYRTAVGSLPEKTPEPHPS